MKRRNVFPFCAVIGQDNIKKALILNIINPYIGGVLISGEKGTAKSTLVRGMAAALRDTEVVELPLNVTEDRLIGTIDIGKAIKEGERCFEPGILKRADGNILYVDEVNLLSEYIVNCLLEVSASHVNHVEREGISCSHRSKFVLVGTMNPEEGALRPQFLDRFGLYVEVKGTGHPGERKEIVKRRLEYEKNPGEYVKRWREATEQLSDSIAAARRGLSLVKVSESILKLASEISTEGNCAGHRAELAVIETARAIAAFDSRKNVTVADIRQAAELALPHRVRQQPQQMPLENEKDGGENDYVGNAGRNTGINEAETDGNPEETGQTEDREQEREDRDPGEAFEDDEDNIESGQNPAEASGSSDEESVEEPGEIFEIKPLDIQTTDRKKRRGSGKRSRTKTGMLQGRYIRYTFPRGKPRDIAFDATFRAAAPYQKSRESNGMALTIKDSDFREKIREKRTGSTILFIVDASGSMGVKQRMKAVKSTILSILNDAYQKRDKVGMLAFRKDSAQLLLGITRSVDLAQKNLRDLPTGGKTPLATGLYRGYEVIKAAKLKDPDMIPVIVLVSDGRANVPLNGCNAFDDAVGMAKIIAAEGIKALVIDTEKDFIKLRLASKIADAMAAAYFKLEEIEEKAVETAVRSMVQTQLKI